MQFLKLILFAIDEEQKSNSDKEAKTSKSSEDQKASIDSAKNGTQNHNAVINEESGDVIVASPMVTKIMKRERTH